MSLFMKLTTVPNFINNYFVHCLLLITKQARDIYVLPLVFPYAFKR